MTTKRVGHLRAGSFPNSRRFRNQFESSRKISNSFDFLWNFDMESEISMKKAANLIEMYPNDFTFLLVDEFRSRSFQLHSPTFFVESFVLIQYSSFASSTLCSFANLFMLACNNCRRKTDFQFSIIVEKFISNFIVIGKAEPFSFNSHGKRHR